GAVVPIENVAVRLVDHRGHAPDPRGQAADESGLRRVCVDDRRPLMLDQSEQLAERSPIVERGELPAAGRHVHDPASARARPLERDASAAPPAAITARPHRSSLALATSSVAGSLETTAEFPTSSTLKPVRSARRQSPAGVNAKWWTMGYASQPRVRASGPSAINSRTHGRWKRAFGTRRESSPPATSTR